MIDVPVHRVFGLPDPPTRIVLRLADRDILRVLVYEDVRALRRACLAIASRPPARHALGAVFAAHRSDTFAVMLLCHTHLTAEIIAHECLHVVALAARRYRLRLRDHEHEEWMAGLMGSLVAAIARETRRRTRLRSGGKRRAARRLP